MPLPMSRNDLGTGSPSFFYRGLSRSVKLRETLHASRRLVRMYRMRVVAGQALLEKLR